MPHPITDADLAVLRANVREDTREEIAKATEVMREDFSQLHTSVDHYTTRTETWYQEHIILKARHDHLTALLARKGIVTEDELAL